MVKIYSFSGEIQGEVYASDSSYHFAQIMGENYVLLDFVSPEYIDIPTYSYIEYDGNDYYMADAPEVTKVNESQYSYKCKFVAPQELFKNVKYKFVVEDGQTHGYNETKFSVMYTAKDFVEMLVRNLNQRLFKDAFSVGEVLATTRTKLLTFDYMNCYDAINQIAQEFGTEWFISGNQANGWRVNLVKQSYNEDNPQKIKYGKGNGVLPNIKRSLHSQSDKATHLFIQGGNRNIQRFEQNEESHRYEFESLHLPNVPAKITNCPATIGYDGDNPNWKEGGLPPANSILFDVKNGKFAHEDNDTLEGFNIANAIRVVVDRSQNIVSWVRNTAPFYKGVVKEEAIDLTDIYPQRVGRVTAINTTEEEGVRTFPNVFYDTTNNIDFSKYFINGQVATIVFQTGKLAGKEFKIATNNKGELTGYNNIDKSFRLVIETFDGIAMPCYDANGYKFDIQVGDEYAIFGIALPDEYLSEVSYSDSDEDPTKGVEYHGAEWDLLRQACIEVYRRAKTKYTYSLSLDANWLQSDDVKLGRVRLGEWLELEDDYITEKEPTTKCYYDTWNSMRIVSIKTFLNKPMFPEISLGEPAPKGLLAKVREIQTGTASNTIAQQQANEQTQKELQEQKQEQQATNEKLEQKIEIVNLVQSSGGTGGKLPFKGEITLLKIGTDVWAVCENIYHQTLGKTTLTCEDNFTELFVHYWQPNPEHILQMFGNTTKGMWKVYEKPTPSSEGTRPRTVTTNAPFSVFIYLVVNKEQSLTNLYLGDYDLVGASHYRWSDAYIEQHYPTKTLYCVMSFTFDPIALTITDEERYFGWEYISPAVMRVKRISSHDNKTYFDIEGNKIKGNLFIEVDGEEIAVSELVNHFTEITPDDIRKKFEG